MTIAIVTLMLLGYLLICTEHITRINKATVALFCGVWGWVLYVCVGPYYIETLHDAGFQEFLGNEDYLPSSERKQSSTSTLCPHSVLYSIEKCNVISAFSIIFLNKISKK